MNIDDAILEFYTFTNIKKMNVEIIITDDIYLEKVKHSNNINRENIIMNKEWIESLNGTVCEPLNLEDSYIILINKNYMEKSENYEWVGTVCHELTHVWDYIEYSKIKGYDSYEVLREDSNINMFLQWSEFHARYIGHYVLRKILHQHELKSQIALIDLLQRELPFQMKSFFDNYNDPKNYGNQLYFIMHFLGRLKVWMELFPNYFKNDVIKHILGKDNEWLNELFIFLNKNDTVELVNDKFNDMEKIIMKNFNII